jgi:hypothetical protein
MASEHSIARYRNLYAKLLRLYPKPYRERFGEGLEQTFSDLLRERRDAERGLFAFALWMFVETSAGIIRENITVIIMHNITKRLIVWKAGTTVYRAALALALAAAFLLVWFNAAVAESGDSPGPMFFGVVAVLIIGALIARFRPRGMTYALSATALAQALVAVIAMIAWGQYLELSILNGFFIALWVGSAILFRRATRHGLEVKPTA